MSPQEMGRWYNAMRPRPKINGMTEDQAQMLTDMINENPDEFS